MSCREYQRKSGNFLEERTFDLLLKEGTNFYIFDNSRTFNLLLKKNKHIDWRNILYQFLDQTCMNVGQETI
jgi:hypothetical protein